MFLGINIGNSFTSIGLFKTTPEIYKYMKIANKELWDIKTCLLEIVSPKEQVEAVMIASVVPQKNETFARIIEAVYGVVPFFIDPSLLNGAYPELGADRVANLIGGQKLFGLPVCVIDFGTATTIDVLIPNSQSPIPNPQPLSYGGGVILPGVSSGLKSLHQNTALLPNVDFSAEITQILGKSTHECIKAGAYWGEVYRIQGLINKIKETINPIFVCTGGMGEQFAKVLALKYEPLLTLYGLYFIWKHFKY
ncbi:MAG: type III pantothenate kinase [Candidatus Stahlbacteria bacterium]|nr:type III pantothenate kinase [Candidatus Stahlbacteria bacterium]